MASHISCPCYDESNISFLGVLWLVFLEENSNNYVYSLLPYLIAFSKSSIPALIFQSFFTVYESICILTQRYTLSPQSKRPYNKNCLLPIFLPDYLLSELYWVDLSVNQTMTSYFIWLNILYDIMVLLHNHKSILNNSLVRVCQKLIKRSCVARSLAH